MIQKLESYKTSKNEYGKCLFDNKLCFYKIKNNIKNEVIGYDKIKNFYNTPLLLYHDDNIVIYEYDGELISNTLHEYLYYDKKINYDLVLNPYINSFKNKKILNEEDSVNKCFFKGRIDKINYEPLCDIINDMKNVLKSDKNLTCILTQGDPTDTNISCNGLFTDFENAGYNSVIGEIAIMFASFITHGKYFYPKYNKLSYVIRSDFLSKYNKYSPLMDKMNVPDKNKKLMLSFLDIFKNDTLVKDEINKYLKYYIIMRMLSPIDINSMDNDDQNILTNYIKKIYSMEFNIDSFTKLIKEEI